jgi:nucleoside-diphosphate-sugar epimerase
MGGERVARRYSTQCKNRSHGIGKENEPSLIGCEKVKVLVTGAGSLLMREVAIALAARGDEVVCMQRRTAHFPEGVRVHQELGDIASLDAVTKAMTGCDVVVHGAARVGILGTWNEFYNTNVVGTQNVLSAARSHGISRIVHVSTPSVAHVGHSLVGAVATPAVTGHKRAFYAESKAIAEIEALNANNNSCAVVAIRPHLVWGPGDTQLVGRIVQRAEANRLAMVGSGDALIDSTYISNAVSALVAAVDAVQVGAPCAGNAYVIANGEPRTVRELMQKICDAAGVPFHPKKVPLSIALVVGSLVERVWPRVGKGEPPLTRFVAEQLGTAHWFDPRPAREDLKWSPAVTLDEGFLELHEWFLKQPKP